MKLKDNTICKGGETVVGTDKDGKPVEGVVVGGHFHKGKGFLHLVVARAGKEQIENHLVSSLPAENFLIKPQEEKQSTPDTGTVAGA